MLASATVPSRGAQERYIELHFGRFVRELREFVRFPTISATAGSELAARRCVTWLRRQLVNIGATHVRLLSGRTYPSVFATLQAKPGAPHVLIYGHYDVQPACPEHKWTSPPFDPLVRAGKLYGRGASDDKGQVFAHLKAVEMLRALGCGRDVRISFFIDGEEEIGSPALRGMLGHIDPNPPFDVAVVSDTPILGLERPSITHALRGDLYLEVDVKGPSGDLHSGNFGGAVDNTLEALIDALSSLHEDTGRVAVPGFYDDVLSVPWSERRYMHTLGPSAREIHASSGGARLSGERGYTAYERMTIRPSLDVSGLSGGHLGTGVKGVIPSGARAKLDIRTVLNQQPDRIRELVTRHLRSRLPKGMALNVKELMRIDPVVLKRNSPMMQLAQRAYAIGFGKEPVFVRLGGSIAVVAELSRALGVPVIPMGLALPTDGAHAVDEHWPLVMLRRGIATSAAFLSQLGRGA